MTISFYPHDEDVSSGSLKDRVELMMEAAERYKAAILDPAFAPVVEAGKRATPKEMKIAFNWQAVAKILREARELPEATPVTKLTKADVLKRLADIYEVLRGAKMPKLEAMRLALIAESTQLRGSSSS